MDINKLMPFLCLLYIGLSNSYKYDVGSEKWNEHFNNITDLVNYIDHLISTDEELIGEVKKLAISCIDEYVNTRDVLKN